MGKNFLEGYARRLSAAELEARPTRYWLPHFGVPKVPGRPELRLVYDAAAKFRGTCLNDYVTPGPALQNPLPAVVLRFREGAVAWSADIGAMFSRIRLDDVDRQGAISHQAHVALEHMPELRQLGEHAPLNEAPGRCV